FAGAMAPALDGREHEQITTITSDLRGPVCWRRCQSYQAAVVAPCRLFRDRNCGSTIGDCGRSEIRADRLASYPRYGLDVLQYLFAADSDGDSVLGEHLSVECRRTDKGFQSRSGDACRQQLFHKNQALSE